MTTKDNKFLRIAVITTAVVFGGLLSYDISSTDSNFEEMLNIFTEDSPIIEDAYAYNVRPLYRLYNDYTGDHFYTISAEERDVAINNHGIWKYEDQGVAAYVLDYYDHPAFNVPFYRLYNTSTGDHFYTKSIAEKNDKINNHGYIDEGIVAYVFPDDSMGTPLYRLENKVTGDNFYTKSISEKNDKINYGGYQDKGIAAWVY